MARAWPRATRCVTRAGRGRRRPACGGSCTRGCPGTWCPPSSSRWTSPRRPEAGAGFPRPRRRGRPEKRYSPRSRPGFPTYGPGCCGGSGSGSTTTSSPSAGTRCWPRRCWRTRGSCSGSARTGCARSPAACCAIRRCAGSPAPPSRPAPGGGQRRTGMTGSTARRASLTSPRRRKSAVGMRGTHPVRYKKDGARRRTRSGPATCCSPGRPVFSARTCWPTCSAPPPRGSGAWSGRATPRTPGSASPRRPPATSCPSRPATAWCRCPATSPCPGLACLPATSASSPSVPTSSTTRAPR